MNKDFEISSYLQASAGQRFLNYIIDLIICYSIILLIFAALAIIANLVGNLSILEWMGNISDGESYLITFSIFILYYTLTEGLLSRSIAKYITKTKVVMEDGSKPTVGTAFKRTLCRFIPFEGFTFLTGNQGWHDSIPNTYVVKSKEFDEERNRFYEFEQIGVKED